MEENKGFSVQLINDEKGIGVCALENYKVGDVIFEESPIVSAQFAWNKEYKYLACDHCLRPLESTQENVTRLTQNPSIVVPFPEICSTKKAIQVSCSQCGATYCCEECKQLAWNQYHRTVCEYQQPLKTLYNAWMNIHYPPETTSIELLIRIIASIEQSNDKEESFRNLMQFSHETNNPDSEVSLRLLGEKGLQNLSVIQPILSNCIPTTVTASLVTMEGLKSFFALVGRNGQGIGTSVLSEWVEKVTSLDLPKDEKERLDEFIVSVYREMDKVVGTFLNNEGSGLYRLQRCLNHSCNPNTEVTFPHSNHTLSLVATSDISPGEEICISYLDECALSRSRYSRRKILREYYLFECNCSKCVNEIGQEDEHTSEDEMEEDEDSD